MSANEVLAFYTQPGPLSDAGAHRDALVALPGDVPALLAAVQGNLVHQALTHLYDFELTDAQRETAHFRSATGILGRILDEDQRPLTDSREPRHRFACTCRTFTLVTVAALRAHGTPARARCGFGNYFPGDWHIDHWVAEHWDGERWVLSDAQMDPVQVKEFGLDFDPADVPRDRFVVAGQAWTAYRAGELDADKCGLPGVPGGESGPWWIAGNLIRDVAALSNMELLPWDDWGAMPAPEDEIGPDLTALFDELAAVTADPATAAEVRSRYAADERLRVPEQVRNAVRQTAEPVIPVD
jgi:hypothetical protein